MPESSIHDYVKQTRQAVSANLIKDPRIFDIDYVPGNIFIRQDCKPLVEELILYADKGPYSNVLIYGGSGYGKTVTVQKFTESIATEKNIPVFYINCIYTPTLYKIYASILGKGYLKGYATNELQDLVAEKYPRCILILDEIHHLRDNTLLYFISRDSKFKPMVVAMTQHLRWLDNINDPGVKSSFRPKEISFKPYNADEINEILISRAESGLRDYDKGAISYLSGATKRDYQSDMRTAIIALKNAGRTGIWEIDTLEKYLKQADNEKWREAVHRLNEKQLLLLHTLVSENRTNIAYEKFRDISKVYYFQLVRQLESQDMIMLIQSSHHGGQTYNVEVLVDPDIIAREREARSTLAGYL